MRAEKVFKETLQREIQFNPESISPSEKMKMLLKIFDLGNNPEQNKERRRKFLDLVGAYHQSAISSKAINLDLQKEDLESSITPSDTHKKKLHDKIMAILFNASMSRNRNAVEQMIVAYFSSSKSARPTTPSEVFRGEGPFFRKPGDED